MVNQAKLKSFCCTPIYQYGYEVPRTYQEALEIDKRNGNTKWQDAIKLEMIQLDEYNTFKDLGHKNTARVPGGYKKIQTHLVFAIKHDGHHKARICLSLGPPDRFWGLHNHTGRLGYDGRT